MDIYKLALGETVEISSSAYTSTEVERVPGGWNYIYTRLSDDNVAVSAVFVPFNKEFLKENTETKL